MRRLKAIVYKFVKLLLKYLYGNYLLMILQEKVEITANCYNTSYEHPSSSSYLTATENTNRQYADAEEQGSFVVSACNKITSCQYKYVCTQVILLFHALVCTYAHFFINYYMIRVLLFCIITYDS